MTNVDSTGAAPAAPYIAHAELVLMQRRLGAIWGAMGVDLAPSLPFPLVWAVNVQLRCCSGHVTDRLSWPDPASGLQGAICVLCHEPVVITFPFDQTGPFIPRDPHGVRVCIEHDDCLTNLELGRNCAAVRLGRGQP